MYFFFQDCLPDTILPFSTPEQNDALLIELRNVFKSSQGEVTMRLRELESQIIVL
jgi:hypothetical protein